MHPNPRRHSPRHSPRHSNASFHRTMSFRKGVPLFRAAAAAAGVADVIAPLICTKCTSLGDSTRSRDAISFTTAAVSSACTRVPISAAVNARVRPTATARRLTDWLPHAREHTHRHGHTREHTRTVVGTHTTRAHYNTHLRYHTQTRTQNTYTNTNTNTNTNTHTHTHCRMRAQPSGHTPSSDQHSCHSVARCCRHTVREYVP